MQRRIYGESWFQKTNGKIQLIGCLCKSCETHWFPKRQICPNCLGEQLKEVQLSNTAEVYSLSKLHVTSKGFEKPITIAYIDFPEGVRVCGQVEGVVSIGSKVEAVYGKIRSDVDGTPVFSYKFRVFE